MDFDAASIVSSGTQSLGHFNSQLNVEDVLTLNAISAIVKEITKQYQVSQEEIKVESDYSERDEISWISFNWKSSEPTDVYGFKVLKTGNCRCILVRETVSAARVMQILGFIEASWSVSLTAIAISNIEKNTTSISWAL